MSLTLTNYWWLLIWLFVGGAICNYFPKRREVLGDRVVKRWDIVPAIILVVPYIIWAGFRGDWADTGLYRMGFLNQAGTVSKIPSVFAGDGKDPGFTALIILLKVFIGNSDELFFLIVAAFHMLCIVKTYRKFSINYWFCIFLFIVSTDYMSWMHNGIRQFIAATAIFACFDWLLEKRFIPLIAVVLLASTIHGSALLMIPIIFIVQGKAWNIKTIFTLILTMVVVVFIDRFTPMLDNLLQNTQYDKMMTNGIWENDDGTNIIRVLVYSAPALFSLLGLKHIRRADNPVVNISVNCSIVTMAIYLVSAVSSGIYIGRLPIYTTLQGYMALPWLIENVFERKSSQLMYIITIAMYIVFFFFQMHFIWGLI